MKTCKFKSNHQVANDYANCFSMYIREEKAQHSHLTPFPYIYIYCLHLQVTILLERSILSRYQCDYVLQDQPTLYSIKLTSSVSFALIYNIRSISGG